jgi:hypothetical protein
VTSVHVKHAAEQLDGAVVRVDDAPAVIQAGHVITDGDEQRGRVRNKQRNAGRHKQAPLLHHARAVRAQDAAAAFLRRFTSHGGDAARNWNMDEVLQQRLLSGFSRQPLVQDSKGGGNTRVGAATCRRMAGGGRYTRKGCNQASSY